MNGEQEPQGSKENTGLQKPPGPKGDPWPQAPHGSKRALSELLWVAMLGLSVLLCVVYSLYGNYAGGALMFVATLLALYPVLSLSPFDK